MNKTILLSLLLLINSCKEAKQPQPDSIAAYCWCVDESYGLNVQSSSMACLTGTAVNPIDVINVQRQDQKAIINDTTKVKLLRSLIATANKEERTDVVASRFVLVLRSEKGNDTITYVNEHTLFINPNKRLTYTRKITYQINEIIAGTKLNCTYELP